MLRDDGLAAADVDAVAVDGLADAVLGRWRFSCCRMAVCVFSRRVSTNDFVCVGLEFGLKNGDYLLAGVHMVIDLGGRCCKGEKLQG